MFKYLRVRIYKALLRPISGYTRGRRMKAFRINMGIKEGLRVLDLGGQPGIWATIPESLNITILNLPGIAEVKTPTHHVVTYVEGDACQRQDGLDPDRFDLVFSNSVIEHVGSADKRAAFARELRRLGKPYWVQTPAKWFPIEPHCGMPFWWFYPKALQNYFLTRWRKKLPAWTDMVEQTTFLTRKELRALFPEAEIHTETLFGLPKSYMVYATAAKNVRAADERDAARGIEASAGV